MAGPIFCRRIILQLPEKDKFRLLPLVLSSCSCTTRSLEVVAKELE